MRKLLGRKSKSKTNTPENTTALLDEAAELTRTGNIPSALSKYKSAISKDKGCIDAYRNRAIIYSQIQNYDLALADAHKLNELEPNSYDNLTLRGLVYYFLGQYKESLLDHNNAIKIAPNVSYLYCNRGLSQMDPNKALSDFGYALQLDYTYVQAVNNRGVLYTDLQRYDEALADFTWIANNYATEQSIGHMGVALQNCNRHQEAVHAFDRVIQMNNTASEAFNNKGFSLHKLGDIDGALFHFETAISLDENNSNAYYNRGCLLKKVGRFEESMPDFAKALSIRFGEKEGNPKTNKQKLQFGGKSVAKFASEFIQNWFVVGVQLGGLLLGVASTLGAWAADLAAPGAGAGVGLACDAIGVVFSLAAFVVSKIVAAKANNQQCNRLRGKIITVCESIAGLDLTSNTDHYYTALKKLEECLQAAQQLVNKFSDKTWFSKVLTSGTDTDAFAEVNQLLNEAVQLLQLGVNVQSLLNDEEARKDAEADRMEMKSHLQEIIKMNMDVKAQLQQAQLDSYEREKIMAQQIASMQNNFVQTLEAKPDMAHEKEFKGINVIPFYTLDFISKIADGKHGAIYSGTYNNEEVTIKEICGIAGDASRAQFLREATVMSKLRSRYFALFYGICCEDDRNYIIMENVPCSLEEYIVRNQNISLVKKHQIAIDVVSALDFLHRITIYHRDFSSANIMIDKDGNAKLADLGLVKVDTTNTEINVKTIASGAKRTLKILPPEYFSDRKKSTEKYETSDIWALGILLWELFSSKIAFANMRDEEMSIKIASGYREKFPPAMLQFYRDLIDSCWNSKPNLRPSCSFVLDKLRNYKVPDIESIFQEGLVAERKNDFNTAFSLYEIATGNGSMRARTNLACMYFQGIGPLDVDKQTAFGLFTQSANEGHVRAIVNLATMYLEGWDNIPPDMKKAVQWLEKGRQLGDQFCSQKLDSLRNPQR